MEHILNFDFPEILRIQGGGNNLTCFKIVISSNIKNIQLI